MNYEKDVTIDENSLDIEWIEQPKLMLKYGTTLSDGVRALEFAKEQLEVVRAELDKEIRQNPEKFEIQKITESVVQNTILLQEKYQEQNNKVIEAKHTVDMAKTAVRSMDGKKDALENLVRLHGQQYFAGPSVPRDLSKEWEAKQKQKSADSSIKLKRKK